MSVSERVKAVVPVRWMAGGEGGSALARSVRVRVDLDVGLADGAHQAGHACG
jgi:hypothetical protein